MERRTRGWAAAGTFLARTNRRPGPDRLDGSSTPSAAENTKDLLWRTLPLTVFRDAPEQRSMVRKDLFPEDACAGTFLHVALDGLKAR